MELDEDLVKVLRAQPFLGERARRETGAFLRRAERHGVAAVVESVLKESRVELSGDVKRECELRAVARELDHAALLRTVGVIDAALAEDSICGVALKGVLFAERHYALPSGRATSDIDLMIDEGDVERAARSLERVGFRAVESVEEERFRREHHHLHFYGEGLPPLELHFHAYRGFGSTLRSEPLIERARRYRGLQAVRVLAPADEVVYLAVHAAAHRFIRLGWLYDLRLLIERMADEELEEAGRRARETGYARVIAYTAGLLEDGFGMDPKRLAPLGRLDALRRGLVDRIVAEPESALRRAATRFVYSIALCDRAETAIRYAGEATIARGRLLFK
jgi:hypothetical protein